MRAKTLTVKEARPSRATYQAQRRAQLHCLYFASPEDLARHRALAEAQGYWNRLFNAWLLQMMANGTSGSMYPPEYVSGLEKELERVRGWLDSARDENKAPRAEVRTLQQQRDALLALVTELDPEQAAGFLKQARERAVGPRLERAAFARRAGRGRCRRGRGAARRRGRAGVCVSWYSCAPSSPRSWQASRANLARAAP